MYQSSNIVAGVLSSALQRQRGSWKREAWRKKGEWKKRRDWRKRGDWRKRRLKEENNLSEQMERAMALLQP